MSRICPLLSSSSGNSTYIAAPTGAVLVDAGASLRAIEEALQAAGGAVEEISALFLTHTHSDHIRGLKPLLNRTHMPLYATKEVLATLLAKDGIPAGVPVEEIGEGETEVAGIGVRRFLTEHDCAGSCGYAFFLPDGKKISVCTDLGRMTETVREAIRGSDAILIESNHDIDMLKKGPYTPELKARILSDHGHLSNNACAAELAGLLQSGTKRFLLGHLSQHNNTPLLAESCATAALADAGAFVQKDYLLSVAAPKHNRVTVL